MNYHGLVKRLDQPAGWLPPAELEYDDIRAAAISGARWQQAGPGWTRSVLNDIACPAALTCYLAGTHDVAARITNGTTLAAPRSPTARNLYGIGCAGPGACNTVGDGGAILALR